MILAGMEKPGDAAFQQEVCGHCVAAILGAVVFGNVCSPIADTSVLTSLASGCELTRHVKTTLPYSCLVALCAFLFGSVPVALGWYPGGVGLLLGVGALLFALLAFGQKVDGEPEDESPVAAGLRKAGCGGAVDWCQALSCARCRRALPERCRGDGGGEEEGGGEGEGAALDYSALDGL